MVQRFAITRSTGEAALFGVIALATFAVAAYGGTYGVVPRTSLAIGVWWIVFAGVAAGAWAWARIPPSAIAVGLLLLAFAVLSGLSGAWGESAEKSFVEANRVMLYLGVFTLAVLAIQRTASATWLNAVGFSAAAIAVVAMLSRLFSHLFSEGPLPAFLPYAHTRLSFPLNYWNGLAIFVSLGVAPLLRLATTSPQLLIRGLAVMPFPIFVSVIYLASSRTGAITAAVGALLFIVLSRSRWPATLTTAVAAVGSTIALAWLAHEHELVSGPLDTSKAFSEGRWTALVLGVVCVALAVAFAFGSRFLRRYRAPSPNVSRALAAAVVALVVVAVIAAHPIRRFDNFKRPPPSYSSTQYIGSHFLSSNGNWRWQYWTAAVREFEGHPIGGGGAGSYEAWWAQHGSIPGFVRNAHSLYVEVLGELGILGLLLLVSAFGGALFVGVTNARRARFEDASVAAAAIAGFAAFAVGAGLDWMWQLTAVPVVGMIFLAIAVGRDRLERDRPRLLRIAVTILALVALLGEADLLLANLKIEDSQTAAGSGRIGAAASDARAARDFQPWASTPYLQLALLDEQAGRLNASSGLIYKAINRDRQDWRLWLVAARIQIKLGNISAARDLLDEARRLNPRSGTLAASNR